MLGIQVIPLTDAWAVRRFAVCFPVYAALQPAARRLVDTWFERAAQEVPRRHDCLRGLALLLLLQAAGEALAHSSPCRSRAR